MQKFSMHRIQLPRPFLLLGISCFCAVQIFLGCGPAMHDHAHGDAGGEVSQEVTSENGTYRVSYSTEPEMIPFNETFELHAMVERVDGVDLADDVDVQVDAGMPSHNHGMNTAPSTMAMGGGEFHTMGMLFHMEGRWEITVDITEGDSTERATFQVDVAQ